MTGSKHALITGGAGFIGSSMVDRLLSKGLWVTAYDNFSTGRREFLESALKHPQFRLVEKDILDKAALVSALEGVDTVFHFAANADVRFGLQHPSKDLEQNTIGTFTVLEAMREAGCKRIAFSSTGSVYGESPLIPTPEDGPFPIQTSLYGASKLGGEGLISAYCEGFGFQGFIFRFVSVLGERYTHGHVFDFCKTLSADPSHLHILGDGKQKKSYIYIQDCLDAILVAMEHCKDKVGFFNLGTDECVEVNDSVRWITAEMGLNPRLTYEGGKRGWVGDSPHIFLDCRKIRSLGWKPKLTIEQGVRATLKYLIANPHLMNVG